MPIDWNILPMKWLLLMLMISTVLSQDQCSCPTSCSDKEKLGRSTWFLLHSIVKNVEQTLENEEMFVEFMDILSQLYPCKECREHFILNLKNIDQVEMTEKWMCMFHNKINQQLHKPLYSCTNDRILE